MRAYMTMIALSAVVISAPMARAQNTNVGNTQKGSVEVKKSGTGAGTQADSMRLLASTVKSYPPCQGSRMRPSDVTPSVTGSPGGLNSPDQVAPLPQRTRTKNEIRADSIRAARQDTVPNCAAMSDSLRKLRRALRDSAARHP